MKKSFDTVKQTWEQVGWAPQINNQYIQTQALVSPIKSFSMSLDTATKVSQTSLKPPPML